MRDVYRERRDSGGRERERERDEQHNTTQRNATQRNATQRNATQRNATQRSAAQRNATQRNATQRNATKHNTTQHNTTQHNTTQHNTTQHNTEYGVHLNSVGVSILAKNLINHIAGQSQSSCRSTPSYDVTSQRTPFGEILFSEAVKNPIAAARDISTGFRIRHQARRVAIRKTTQPHDEWSRYLVKVRTLLNPQCVRPA